tara:strand:+ start:1681 stop:2328 length:648 start_codon:yes stop_codon:yes gene_type:complete
MKKRLNIQYSVEESQIGDECYRLLSNSLSRLTSIAATSPKSESIMNVSTIKEITGLRQELSQVDVMLDDVNAIIDGFLNYKYEEQTSHTQPQAQTAPAEKMEIPSFLSGNAQDIDLNQLTDFIKQMKGTQPNNFNMSEVENIGTALGDAPAPELEREKIQEMSEAARSVDPNSVEAEELLNLFSGLQASGGSSIEDIGRKLQGLKSRIDSSEIPD